MSNIICDAISTQNIITFYYNGGNRIVEPHCYGTHKDTGNEVLCGYQTGGYSESGNLPGWRLYIVPNMTNIQVTNEQFASPRPEYNPNDSRMSRIFCNL